MTEELLNRLIQLSKIIDDAEGLKSRLNYKDGNLYITGTDLVFTSQEIQNFSMDDAASSNKIAQSDVPDNMLSLLTALKATSS